MHTAAHARTHAQVLAVQGQVHALLLLHGAALVIGRLALQQLVLDVEQLSGPREPRLATLVRHPHARHEPAHRVHQRHHRRRRRSSPATATATANGAGVGVVAVGAGVGVARRRRRQRHAVATLLLLLLLLAVVLLQAVQEGGAHEARLEIEGREELDAPHAHAHRLEAPRLVDAE